jgi:hypothetical protein
MLILINNRKENLRKNLMREFKLRISHFPGLRRKILYYLATSVALCAPSVTI